MRSDVVTASAPVVWPLTGLLAMWLFGNLYEELVWLPGLIARPVPGSVPGALAAGSPVYYYLPWTPLSLLLAVVLLVRFGRRVPTGVRARWRLGLGLLVLAVLGKVLLINLVNPHFRDRTLAPGTVRDYAVLWEFGNGAVIVAVAVAILLFVGWRAARTRRRAAPDGKTSTVDGDWPAAAGAR